MNIPFLGSKERDSETGLDYFGARYYSNTQGRFTSPDQPLVDQNEGNPQSWNLYTYVRNNPLKYTDPGGDSCYYSESGTLIGCDGDKRIRVEGERLYFTPKKESAPLIYDLNKLKVQEEIAEKPCKCKPIPTEGQFAGAVFAVWGGSVFIGGTGGAALHAVGVTVGGSFTTLGLSQGATTSATTATTVTATVTEIALNPNIYRELEKQLAGPGRDSIYKALRSAEKALQQHLDKLPNLQYKSQVEKTIRNIQSQIETIKQFIKDKGL